MLPPFMKLPDKSINVGSFNPPGAVTKVNLGQGRKVFEVLKSSSGDFVAM